MNMFEIGSNYRGNCLQLIDTNVTHDSGFDLYFKLTGQLLSKSEGLE